MVVGVEEFIYKLNYMLFLCRKNAGQKEVLSLLEHGHPVLQTINSALYCKTSVLNAQSLSLLCFRYLVWQILQVSFLFATEHSTVLSLCCSKSCLHGNKTLN